MRRLRRAVTGKPPRPPIRDQVSAGGVLVRDGGSNAMIAIIRPRGSDRWQLPKGIVEAGDSPESTAVREAWEETGVQSEIVAPLDTIEYWFQAREGGAAVRIHKRVHFFLLRTTGGTIGRDDREIAEARWATLAEALRLLSFPSERAVVELAGTLIAPRD